MTKHENELDEILRRGLRNPETPPPALQQAVIRQIRAYQPPVTRQTPVPAFLIALLGLMQSVSLVVFADWLLPNTRIAGWLIGAVAVMAGLSTLVSFLLAGRVHVRQKEGESS